MALELAAAGGRPCWSMPAAQSAGGRSRGRQRSARRGTESRVLLADLADAGRHAALVERAWSWRGTVDIWVNNAGADVLTGEAAQLAVRARSSQQLWRVDVRGHDRAVARRSAGG